MYGVRDDGMIVRQTRRKVRRPVMQHYMAYHYPASSVSFVLPRQARSKKTVLGEYDTIKTDADWHHLISGWVYNYLVSLIELRVCQSLIAVRHLNNRV